MELNKITPLPEVKDYKVVKQAKKINVNVPLDLMGKFVVIHQSYPNLEWSGLIFAETLGSVENNNLEFNLKDFVLMDLGSASYTEFDMTGEYLEYQMDIDPEFKLNHYLLHSHQFMQCYYSGTDQRVFEENCLLYNVFLSVVVNAKSEFFGKVGSIVEEEFTIKGNKVVKSLTGGTTRIPFEKTETRKVLYEWECNFVIQNPYSNRIAELKKDKEVKRVSSTDFRHTLFDGKESNTWNSRPAKRVYDNDFWEGKTSKANKQLELFDKQDRQVISEQQVVIDKSFVKDLIEQLFTTDFLDITRNRSIYETMLKNITGEEIVTILEDCEDFDIYDEDALKALHNITLFEPKSITLEIYNKTSNYLRNELGFL